MSDPSMVKRVATAIAHAHGGQFLHLAPDGEGMQTVASAAGFGNWGYSPEKYAEVKWDKYLLQARFAIQAMREPTPEMVEVGWRDGNAGWGEGEEMAPIWRAMIDAALVENEVVS